MKNIAGRTMMAALVVLAVGNLNVNAAPKPHVDSKYKWGLSGQSKEYWDEIRKEDAARMAKQQAADGEQSSANFYTGKPYDAELGAYVFKYRNYFPEIGRWQVSDPSGFPDGANNYNYCLSPNRDIDPNGLTVTITIKEAKIVNPEDGHVFEIEQGKTKALVTAFADYTIEIERTDPNDPKVFDLAADFSVAGVLVFSGAITLRLADVGVKMFNATGADFTYSGQLSADDYVAAISLSIGNQSKDATVNFKVKE